MTRGPDRPGVRLLEERGPVTEPLDVGPGFPWPPVQQDAGGRPAGETVHLEDLDGSYDFVLAVGEHGRGIPQDGALERLLGELVDEDAAEFVERFGRRLVGVREPVALI